MLGFHAGPALARPDHHGEKDPSGAVLQHSCRHVGIDKKLDLQRIADVINHERPDLVGLQEVDRNVKRTEGKDASARFVENVVDPLHRLIGRWLRS